MKHKNLRSRYFACGGKMTNLNLINPRRACARVTVLGLCVCPAPRVRNGTSDRRYLRLRRNLESTMLKSNDRLQATWHGKAASY